VNLVVYCLHKVSLGSWTDQKLDHRADRTSLATKVCLPQQVVQQKHSKPLPSLQTSKLTNAMTPASQMHTSIQKLSNWSTSSLSPMSSTSSSYSSVFAAAGGGAMLVPSASELLLMGSFNLASNVRDIGRDADNRYFLQAYHTAECQAKFRLTPPQRKHHKKYAYHSAAWQARLESFHTIDSIEQVMVMMMSVLFPNVFCHVHRSICR